MFISDVPPALDRLMSQLITRGTRAALVARVALAAALLSVAPAAPLHARQADAAATAESAAIRGASVEGITEYSLPNGMKVLLFPDASRPTLAVNVTYFVGSRHESYGETGMAHLLEHLLFKGTPTHPNIMQELTERGGSANATTWVDRTNYYAVVPSTPANLEWAIALEADRMVNSLLRAEDLASEMTVVRNEFEMRENDPFTVLMERSMSTAFLWHNYGNTTIGARSDIENVPIERLHAFYRRYYQPDNAVVVLAGRFDEAEALRLIEQHFGSIPAPAREGDMVLYETYTRDPVQDGERSVTVRRSGDVQILMATYRVPAGSHPDYAAIDVLSHVLGNTPSGRLHRALVDERLATRVGTLGFQLREPGLLMAFAELRRQDPMDAAAAAFVPTLKSVLDEPPTSTEVDRAKTALLRSVELALNNPEQIGIWLSEWASMGDWRLLFIHRDRLREVTQEDVHRVAQAYLKTSNRTFGMFIPTDAPNRATIPEAPPIAPLVAEYRGEEGRTAGEEFEPTPAAVEARTTRITLPNGFRLVLLPKQTRGGQVVGAMTLRHGSEAELMGRATAGSMAGGMLMRGTQQRTREELRDEIARLQAQLNVGGGATTASGSLVTTRQSLAAVLRLLGEVLREPVFDEREFEQLREQRIAAIEEQRSEPQAVASLAFSRAMNADVPRGHPRYVGTFDEQIAALEAVTLEEARAFYREFYGAAAGDLTLVGDFDAAEVEAIARELFAGWTAPKPFARVAQRYRPPAPVDLVLETPDKANAFFLAGTQLPMTDAHADYPALVLANFIFGGGLLNSRLATRIRQNEGLSYGVGSQFSAHPIDSVATFAGVAIYAPENVQRLEAAFHEELERAARDGFTAEELESAKQGFLQAAQVARSQDLQLASMLGTGTYFGRTLEWDAEQEARIAALTLEEVNAAFRRHLADVGLVVVKAGDFDAVGAAPSGDR
jgi:zinc protease